MRKIEQYLACHEAGKTNDIADHLQLSPARTRAILAEMDTIESMDTNTNRRYRLKQH